MLASAAMFFSLESIDEAKHLSQTLKISAAADRPSDMILM